MQKMIITCLLLAFVLPATAFSLSPLKVLKLGESRSVVLEEMDDLLNEETKNVYYQNKISNQSKKVIQYY